MAVRARRHSVSMSFRRQSMPQQYRRRSPLWRPRRSQCLHHLCARRSLTLRWRSVSTLVSSFELAPRQVQMNILCCHSERSREWSGLGKPRHGREGRRLSEREVSESNPAERLKLTQRDPSTSLRFAQDDGTTTARDQPKTGTKDKTSRARNILRPLLPSV